MLGDDNQLSHKGRKLGYPLPHLPVERIRRQAEHSGDYPITKQLGDELRICRGYERKRLQLIPKFGRLFCNVAVRWSWLY